MTSNYVPPTEAQLAEWRELARISIAAQRKYQREREAARNTPTPSPAAEQHATGTPTTPSTDNEPQRAQEGTE